MKHVLVFSCLLLLVHGISQEIKEQIRAEMNKLDAECKVEVGAADDDIAPMLAHQPPTTPKGKCFVACINKKMGFQDASGKISEAGTRAWLAKLKEQDEELYQKMVQVVVNCLPQVSNLPDECETATGVFACVKKEQIAVGLGDIDFNS